MSDAHRERVTEAAQRAQDELRATTPDGGRALGKLRELLDEWRRRGDPAASAADRRLLKALETVNLNEPEAIDTLAAALAPGPEPEPNWASISVPVKRRMPDSRRRGWRVRGMSRGHGSPAVRSVR